MGNCFGDSQPRHHRGYGAGMSMHQINQVPMVYGASYATGNFGYGVDFMNKANRPIIPVSPHEAVQAVVALYNYVARTAEELSFNVGDQLEVLGEYDWAWCKARLVVDREMVGYIPSSFVAIPESLESRPWFFQVSSRSDAERALNASVNTDGSFLIRPGTTSNARYSLSIKEDGKVRHFLIRGNEVEGFYVSPQLLFATIDQLVQFHMARAVYPVPKLLRPCSRTEAPQTVGLSHELADKWEIPKNMIKLKKKLGHGNFGDVHEGLWNNSIKVAIKTLKQGNLDKGEFLKEAEIMKKLIHPKLVQLYGVCSKDDPFYIVTELMSNGDLLNYLRKGKGGKLDVPSLIDMCAQVAAGMAFLESKKFVHRDLAARNVLVGDNNICKVADFGFTRLTQDDLYVATLKSVKLPVKWTAPEALKLKEFTTKSDVWAFGILMFEVIEKGPSPYPGMDNASVYPEISRGYRMPQKIMPHCPDKLYQLMLQCWDGNAKDRPSFSKLAKALDNFYE